MKLFRNFVSVAAAFFVGGFGYAGIELLWRGRTHWSMILAGGICVSIMFMIFSRFRTMGILMRCLTGAVVITFVEFITGCIINYWLGLGIWDYSDQKWNLMGQICPLYTLFWGVLSLPVSWLCIWSSEFIEKKENVRVNSLGYSETQL